MRWTTNLRNDRTQGVERPKKVGCYASLGGLAQSALLRVPRLEKKR